jgi:hypothetical protein
MIEVTKVGELVAEGIDEARVLERAAGLGVPEANGNQTVGVAGPVARLDPRVLGHDGTVVEPEGSGDALGVAAELA